MPARTRRRRGRRVVRVLGDPGFTGRPSLPLELALDLVELEYLVHLLAGTEDDLGAELYVRIRNAHTKARRDVRKLEELERTRR